MRSKGSGLPKYVYRQKIGRHVYYRFRRGRGGAVRLPGSPGDAAFHAAYAKLLVEPETAVGRYDPGSVAHTIEMFYASQNFTNLAIGTQRDYRRYLNRLDNSVGERPISSIDEIYVGQIIDSIRDTPSAANHTISVLRTFFKFAKRRRLLKHDPMEGLERSRGGKSYLRWPDDAIAVFRASAPPSMALAMDIGLFTGQRLSDVIRMTWGSYDGNEIRVRQQKTGTELSIPVHPDLKATLDAIERRGETILTSRAGLPFHPRVFSRDFRDARIKAGLPDGLSFHGLRHTAASRLAEVGATGPEIQAITGHKSLKQVEHYIRQADQKLQAERAISRIPRSRNV